MMIQVGARSRPSALTENLCYKKASSVPRRQMPDMRNKRRCTKLCSLQFEFLISSRASVEIYDKSA